MNKVVLGEYLDPLKCLLSGDSSCLPYHVKEPQQAVLLALDAAKLIDDALNNLDASSNLDSVWMDNGDRPAFDPRLAAGPYLMMVAQESQILNWEEGPGMGRVFGNRLQRRAAFINDTMIPGLKVWVHKRCVYGPNVRSPGGQSPLGTTSQPGPYHSQYLVGTNYADFYDTIWTKNCDYSTAQQDVTWCQGCYPYYSSIPGSSAASNPFKQGDQVELTTLELMGLSSWAQTAANLVGLANGATYEGCFSGAPSHALLPNQRTLDSLSVDACIQAARAAGDSLAQLTSSACYTGDGSAALVRVPDRTCDSPCWGISGQMCGGSSGASSLFRVSGANDVLVATKIVGGKTAYAGCYASPTGAFKVIPVTSADACLSAAVSAHATFASVQPGGVCQLHNSITTQALPEKKCATPCTDGTDGTGVSPQTCGGPGAANVFLTNDPQPAPPVCASGTADCNGNWGDGCEANLALASNCGVCGNVCGTGRSCVRGACVSTSLASVSFKLSQAVGFTGTSSIFGDGAFVAIPGATVTFTAPGGKDISPSLDLFAYVPTPSRMSLDVRYLLDGAEVSRARYATAPFTTSTRIPSPAAGSHTLTVEVRSVLTDGPPTTIQLYGNYAGAASGCYSYGCGATQANLSVNVVP
jgi:hypothetical protein